MINVNKNKWRKSPIVLDFFYKDVTINGVNNRRKRDKNGVF